MEMDWNSAGVVNWAHECHLQFRSRCRHLTIQTLAHSSASRCIRFFFDNINPNISVVEQLSIWVSEANCQIPKWYCESENKNQRWNFFTRQYKLEYCAKKLSLDVLWFRLNHIFLTINTKLAFLATTSFLLVSLLYLLKSLTHFVEMLFSLLP